MVSVYLSLGSNKGDRLGYIQQATSLLNSSEHINIVQTSSFYETEPWNMKSENWFVNAVIQINTNLLPESLMDLCHKIESTLGRIQTTEEGYSDRTIDIDILFYGEQIITQDYRAKKLIIPHSLFHERAFALVPMLEIAPDFIHPVFKKSVNELYQMLDNPEQVYLYGTKI